jgi:hypothetical protein
MKPFFDDKHTRLEELYQKNLQLIKENPNDKTLYQMTEYYV